MPGPGSPGTKSLARSVNWAPQHDFSFPASSTQLRDGLDDRPAQLDAPDKADAPDVPDDSTLPGVVEQYQRFLPLAQKLAEADVQRHTTKPAPVDPPTAPVTPTQPVIEP